MTIRSIREQAWQAAGRQPRSLLRALVGLVALLPAIAQAQSPGSYPAGGYTTAPYPTQSPSSYEVPRYGPAASPAAAPALIRPVPLPSTTGDDQPFYAVGGPPAGPMLAAPPAGRPLPPDQQLAPSTAVVPQGEAIAGPPPGQEIWTLERVTQLAQLYNPILRRSLARIESARGDALQASLYPNPRFDTNNPEVFAGPASSYNVGFMQDIVVKGKKRLDRAAAGETVRQREQGLVQDRYSMLTEVRKQFYLVLAAQRRVQVLSELLSIAHESQRAAEGRVQAGEGTQTEVLLVITELQRAQSAIISSQTLLQGELRQLAATMGLPDLPIPSVTGELMQGIPNFDEGWLREFVVTQHSQVQIARREVDRNQFLLQRARVEPYPNVRVGPTYNWVPQPTGAQGSQQFWFTVQFDIPTWDRNQGNIRSNEADVRDAIASLGVVQNDLLRQAADVLSRHRAARQRAERFEREILPNARRAQQLVREGFMKGILDISTFLQTQRTLTETTVEYIDALEEVWTTAAELGNLLQLEQFP